MNAIAAFPYKPGVGKLILAVMFFGWCSYYLQYAARTNNRGLIIDGIYLNAHGASIFYAVMAIVSAALVVWALIAMVFSLTSNGELRLTETELQIPRGIFQGACIIPFNSIRSTQLTRRRGYGFFKIQSDFRKVTINSTWLPYGAFDQVCTIVAERMDGGQAGKEPVQTVLSQPKLRERALPQPRTFGRKL